MKRLPVFNIVFLLLLLVFVQLILPRLIGAQSIPFQVSSFNYIEYRGDGIYNEQDHGIEGWEVCLVDIVGGAADCRLSDVDGNIFWNDVAIGEYELLQTRKPWHDTAGWWESEPTNGGRYNVIVSEDGSVSYSLNEESVDDAYFGNRLLEIHGHTAIDSDRDGVYDSGTDPSLSGWKVYFDLNENGELENEFEWDFFGLDCNTSPTITECLGEGVEPYMIVQHDGSFHFRNVPQGTYQVRVVPEEGWIVSTPFDYLVQAGDGRVPPTWLDFVMYPEDEISPTPSPTLFPTMTPTPDPTAIPTPEPTQMPDPTPTVIPDPGPTPDSSDPFEVMRVGIRETKERNARIIELLIADLKERLSNIRYYSFWL